MRGNGRGGGGSSRPHASNGSNGAASPSESMLNGKDGPNSGAGGGGGGAGAVNGNLGSGGGVDAAALGSLLGLSGIADPFNLAASLLPPSAALAGGSGSSLSALSGVGPTASLLLTGTLGKRKPGGRTQPGLPPAHFLVQSGTYSQFGKSLAGLSALRGEEVEGDLGEMRRKRQRVGGRRRVYE